MLPLPLAPLLTPMPGCWAWLMSIDGWDGCAVEAAPPAPPEAPAPVEAGGVTREPPPIAPPVAPPLTPPEEAPAPAEAPPPTEPDVWACAKEAAETMQARARNQVFVIFESSRVVLGELAPRRQVARVN